MYVDWSGNEQGGAGEGSERDESSPSDYECYREQWGSVQGNWGDLEAMVWLALIGATEHLAQRQCSRREYLQMMDRIMGLAAQFPDPIYREFRTVWDDAFPTLKGRY